MANRPLALVTGASAGIGRALALGLARRGHDLILTARRSAELEALAAECAGVTCHVITSDLADLDGPRRLLDEIAQRGLQVDVLINNAGLGVYGPFIEADPDRLQTMLRVNVLALTDLARRILPGMVQRRQGRVMNVASTAAFQPGPLMAAYYASKAYVLSLSEAMSYELRGTGVTVTCLCPGPTRTEFGQVAAMGESKLFDGPGVMEAGPVAEAGLDGMFRGRRVVIPGFANRTTAFMTRFAPKSLIMRVVERVQARKNPH